MYYFFDGKFVYIFRIQSFLKSNIIERKINREALKKYIIKQSKVNLVEGIDKLIPGEIIQHDLGT